MIKSFIRMSSFLVIAITHLSAIEQEDTVLSKIKTATVLHFGGIGPNPVRSNMGKHGYSITDISVVTNDPTILTVNINPDAHADITGDAFQFDAILERFPALKEKKFKKIIWDHIGNNLLQDLVDDKERRTSYLKSQPELYKFLTSSIAKIFKSQFDLLSPCGTFEYKTFEEACAFNPTFPKKDKTETVVNTYHGHTIKRTNYFSKFMINASTHALIKGQVDGFKALGLIDVAMEDVLSEIVDENGITHYSSFKRITAYKPKKQQLKKK